jgi:hypothetical protein
MKLQNIELNKYRVRRGVYCTNDIDGTKGFFIIPGIKIDLNVLSSGANNLTGWEHVSVSGKKRNPNWDEMCKIKDLFWDLEETVIQFHPKKTSYVNLHPFCLHLWKNVKIEWELPLSILV